MRDLISFIRESNKIEGIEREPTDAEFEAHVGFLNGPLTSARLEEFVAIIAPGKPMRRKSDMIVCVGNHFPPPGSPQIEAELVKIVKKAGRRGDPYSTHHDYETLHPFMGGNGRSGRALWLWMMIDQGKGDYALSLGFLHAWYYQSLARGRP